jgi:hypothetical protein
VISGSNSNGRKLEILNARIQRATDDVVLAEDELAAAVLQLAPNPVGDKQLITPALEASFEKLRTARRQVTDLQRLLP